MKRLYLLFLFVFLATASFAQFVGASSVGSSSQGTPRDRSFQLFKPHSDSYNSGLLLSVDAGYEFIEEVAEFGLDIGYRFNPYFYVGIGVHDNVVDWYFPIELRAYLPLQNVSFFLGAFAGPSVEGGFSYPSFGGRIGVNRRFWTLSFSAMEAYTKYYYYGSNYYLRYGREYRTYATLSLEYSLPLRAIKQRLYK